MNERASELDKAKLVSTPQRTTLEPDTPNAPRLMEIRQVSDGEYRALVYITYRATWLAEGESSDEYTLLKIDATNRCVELFNDRTAKSVPLCCARLTG